MSHFKIRLDLLRQEMTKHNLDCLLVPHADEFQGEYIAEYAQRLAWLTGFTGSAGAALILADRAIIFVDGRYTLQVKQQTDSSLYEYEDLISCPPHIWLSKYGNNLTIGYDPMLHVINEVENLKKAISSHKNSRLVSLEQNLVDTIWVDQPARPLNPIYLHPMSYSGQSCEDKLKLVQESLTKTGADFTILTDPSSTAWLLNIRGKDIDHTPLALGFTIVERFGSIVCFMEEEKITTDITNILGPVCKFKKPQELLPHVENLVKNNKIALLDPVLCSEKFAQIIDNLSGKYIFAMDPCRLPRACKNKVELEGARKAHLWDGLAVTKFLFWVEQQPENKVTELSAAEQLANFRIEAAKIFGSKLEDQSFSTIAGSGEHGAIIHYRVTNETNKMLRPGELFLIDSGGQYKEGTTDITRTIPIGNVDDQEIKKLYTLVLKGLISLSLAKFIPHSRGADLDILARIALWKHGFNYAHGTGHGVGSFLAVHEGPQNISSRGMAELQTGMILSNEPGYYRAGAFGIRLENLMAVSAPTIPADGELEMHSFETLTYVPFCRQLIDTSLLDAEELDWLNNYHASVLSKLSSYLTEAETAWLTELTKPL
ncbi:aminopeptidase P family protein [Bartonella sp. DGB1]|uniref:aminopeptidase P family protein n=1 Tax=Bartonella sp. DGB1 TaxID=3239807 RepID=UPI003525669C